MDPEAQRIAIARHLGFKQTPDGVWYNDDYPMWMGTTKMLPRYLNSLDAMHEAIETLDTNIMGPAQHVTFLRVLERIVDGTEGCFAVVNATAAQRAEAFLRTIGKWTT